MRLVDLAHSTALSSGYFTLTETLKPKTSMSRIKQFEALLAKGMDNALLRYSLGHEYLQAAQPETAVGHLRAALAHDPDYSAAWKALGQALGEAGQVAAAIAAYRHGIEVAERKGDQQAAKEMAVFRKRLEKSLPHD